MKDNKEEIISKYILIGTGIGSIFGVMLFSALNYGNLGIGMLLGTTGGIILGLIFALIKYKKIKK